MMEKLYKRVCEFLRKYPLTVAFRTRQHIKVLDKHLNDDEEVVYIFPAQKNASMLDIFSTCVIAFTTKRILIAQKRVMPGYTLSSITPDLFNDFLVYKGLIWGRLEMDTVKEVVILSNIDPKALIDIETNLTEYLIKVKPNFKNENKSQK